MLTKELQPTFTKLITKYTSNENYCKKLWKEIQSAHSKPNRYYHGLNHLNHLLEELYPIVSKIENLDVVLFCLYYHDIVYKATNTNNEAQSALFAEKRMKKLSVPDCDINKCYDMIIATRLHQISNDHDTNYFLDADLAILGAPWSTYETYLQNIRKEYAIYPDFIYNRGRKKVLQNFLTMPNIFKTDHFKSKYELTARTNLEKELSLI